MHPNWKGEGGGGGCDEIDQYAVRTERWREGVGKEERLWVRYAKGGNELIEETRHS